jgi:type VI secretion system protein ImpL
MRSRRDHDGLRVWFASRATATVIAPVFALIALLAVVQTRVVSESAITNSRIALAAYTKHAEAVPLDPVTEPELTRLAPLLDEARALPYGPDDHSRLMVSLPWLSQTGKLTAAARKVYGNALQHMLLPQLILRLEGQMQTHFEQPEFFYEATKVYLMLGSAGPLDRELVKQWMRLDWQSEWPGPTAKPLRDSLERHLAALLDQPLEKVPLDGSLVEDARRTFGRVPLAQRVYDAIKTSQQARALAPWRPGDAAGAAGVRLFTRRSGAPLSDGIRGLYTVDGFYKVLLLSLPAAVKEVASESWVLGRQAEIDPGSPQVLTLQNDVIALYSADYARLWDDLLGDLDIAPMRSLQEAVQDLYILSSPQSPMRDLLSGAARQLALTVPPKGVIEARQDEPTASGAGPQGANSTLADLRLQLHAPATSPEPPGKAIADRYSALIAFVGRDPGSPIDGVLQLLAALEQQLSSRTALAAGAGKPAPTTGSDLTTPLRAEAVRAPQPARGWLETIASNCDRLLAQPTRR